MICQKENAVDVRPQGLAQSFSDNKVYMYHQRMTILEKWQHENYRVDLSFFLVDALLAGHVRIVDQTINQIDHRY
jgi:hypothetical protein